MRLPSFASGLSAKLLLGLGGGLLVSSLLFLALLVGLYRGQLDRERGLVSEQVSSLLQASLQNAMLKRDLPGLRDIVHQLGTQSGIAGVMIVNPQLEVRFASRPESIGRHLTFADLGCPTCAAVATDLTRSTWLMSLPGGMEVMRSINPIRNQEECQVCHGDRSLKPVNGILVVDQSTTGLREDALVTAGSMAGAGALVVVLSLLGVWGFMHRTVVTPLRSVEAASRAMAAGDLGVTVPPSPGFHDEIASLVDSFNGMAASLRSSLTEVKEKEAFLQAVIDTVPDGVRVIRDDHTVVMANRAYAALLGEEAAAVVGVPCYKARGRSEPCPPTLTTCPLHAVNDREPTLRYLHEIRSSDGQERVAEMTASRVPSRSSNGRGTLFVEAIRDAKQPVTFSHEQRLSEIGQLATGVAHEIYNPLSSVRLGLLALDRRLKALSQQDAEASEYLRIVNEQIDRCMEVTKRLLDLGTAPSGSLQLVSFSNIIPEVLSLLRFDADRLGVDVQLRLGQDELRVLATDNELRMLILNLAQNAFHAMPGGGKLTISGRLEGGETVVEVGDSGVGIAAEDLPHIFEPFFSKRADKSHGSGLGLTICRTIVKRYGGRLEVRSTPGAGATFVIRIPTAGAVRTAA